MKKTYDGLLSPSFHPPLHTLAILCLLRALALSPPAFASPIPNVPVNYPAADSTARDTQNETTLALRADGTLVSVFNDSGSSVAGANHFVGLAVSANGGTSWTDLHTLPDSAGGDGMNPVLAHAFLVGSVPDTLYLVTTTFSPGENIQLFRAINHSTNFTAPVNPTPGFAGTSDRQLKPWVAVDNTAGPGQGNAYLTWRHVPGSTPGSGLTGGIRFTRSNAGGSDGTWLPNQGLLVAPAPGSTNVQGGFVTVGPDHAVYVFWLEQTNAPASPNITNIIKMKKSFDQGTNFSAVATNVATLVTTGTNGNLGLNGGFAGNAFPQAVVNPANPNLIYVVFNDKGTNAADRSDIFLVTSTNGGATWSAKQRVSDDATTRDQFGPTLTISPDGSRLFIGFYDRRRDPANSLIDFFGVIGTNIGNTVVFSPNFPITTVSFPAVTNQDASVPLDYMGAYDTAIADASFFYVTWGDNRSGNTFHAHQPDVRFAKIPVTGPGGILLFDSAAVTNGNGVIERSECNDLLVGIQNVGTASLTGLTATLSTTTPGVTVVQANSAYPDIAPGQRGTNATPFKVQTLPGFVCGTKVDLVLTVAATGSGAFIIPLQLTSAPPTTVAFSSPDVQKLFLATPSSSVSSTNTVSGIIGPILKVTVSLVVTNPFGTNLDISLVGPDGTTIDLSSGNGAGANVGTNCATARTTFDDDAANAVTSGSSPFLGSFRPERPLSAFIGKSDAAANGTWTLVVDNRGSAAGAIVCWTLNISFCTNGTGPCTSFPEFVSTQVTGGNGNGMVDPDECNDLFVAIRNVGLGGATNVSAHLSVATPGVAIAQADSTYPNIPAGGTGTNDTPFKVSTRPGFQCGRMIDLVLTVTAADGGSFSITFQLKTGSCGAVIFPSTDATPLTPLAIPNPPAVPGFVESTITVPVGAILNPIVRITVEVHITHPRVGQLELTLFGPDGTTIDLSSGNGAGGGDYGISCASPTIFDDAAAVSITNGSAPFLGAFQPEQRLIAYVGKLATGAWKLRVRDTFFADSGTLDCWSLNICQAQIATPDPGVLPTQIFDNFFAENILIPVSGFNFPVGKVTVAIHATNAVDADLDISLISPDGTAVVLSSDNGGNGTFYGASPALPTVFDDDAATSIRLAPAPLSGTFRPEQPLSAFMGKTGTNVNGNWTLRVSDDNSPGSGVLFTALLMITPLACEPATNACPVPLRTLTVASQNATTVPIVVSPPDDLGRTNGSTQFTRQYNNNTLVTLSAPLIAPNGNAFVKWLSNSVQIATTTNVTVNVNRDFTVKAVYGVPLNVSTLTVASTPLGGVPIIVTPPDRNLKTNANTQFTRQYTNGTLVTLTAPSVFGANTFVRWLSNNVPISTTRTVLVTVSANATLTAVYLGPPVVRTLIVTSKDPDSGVSILVDQPDNDRNSDGTTTFRRFYDSGVMVMLTAPARVNGRKFREWEIDDRDQPRGLNPIMVTMNASHTVEARFENSDSGGEDRATSGTTYALQFDGGNDVVEVPDSDSVRITGPITVEAWINRAVAGVEHSVVEKFGCTGDAAQIGGYALRVLDTDQLMFQTKDDCAIRHSVTSATTLSANAWHHVAGVWNGSELKVYVDGVLAGANASTANPKPGNTPLIIGARGNNSVQSPFHGIIDEVRLWNVARSDAEVAANVNFCLAGAEPGLVGYWRLNEGTGRVAHDSTINGNNGMLINGTAWVDSPLICALPSPLPIVAPAPLPANIDGSMRLSISGDMSGSACRLTVTSTPGSLTIVEVSGDLRNWAPLLCTTNVTGCLQVTDPMHPNAHKNFFRVRQGQ